MGEETTATASSTEGQAPDAQQPTAVAAPTSDGQAPTEQWDQSRAMSTITTLRGRESELEKANKADQVKVVAFDGQPEGKQAIKEGKIYADPVQYPDRIGRETADVIARYFAGERVPPQILIPTELYRRAGAPPAKE